MDRIAETRLLRIRVRELEGELAQARQRCQEAETRAAIARKASEDAWRFAKALCSLPRRSSEA